MEEIRVGASGSVLNKQIHKDNLLREQKQVKSQVEEVSANIIMLEEQKQLFSRNAEIAQADFKILNPTWSFEKNDEYQENLKKLNNITNKKKLMENDKQILTLQTLLKNVNEQLNSIEKELERVTKELGDGNE